MSEDIIVAGEPAAIETPEYEDVHVTLLWVKGTKVARSVDLFARERQPRQVKGQPPRPTYWALHLNGKAPSAQNKHRVSLSVAETAFIFGDAGLPTHADVGGQRVELDRGESASGTRSAEASGELPDGRGWMVRTAIGQGGRGHVGVSAFRPGRRGGKATAEVTELTFD